MALALAPACGAPTKYVSRPKAPHRVARLVDDPLAAGWLTPAQWGRTVLVSGADIVPDTAFEVWADCGSPRGAAWAASSIGSTARWGDATGPFVAGSWDPPDGLVMMLDIVAILDAAQGAPTAPPLAACDLVGCEVNELVDIADALAAADAFRGLTYRQSTACPTPCP
jgi:hypothetical protein